MIIREFFRVREDGVNLYRIYSDKGVMIRQETGNLYEESIDMEGIDHTYEETDIEIPTEVDDSAALRFLMGGGLDDEVDEAEEAETGD